MRFLIIFIVVTFLLSTVFGAALEHWYKTNIDFFWSVISIYGFLWLAFMMFVNVEIRRSEEATDEP